MQEEKMAAEDTYGIGYFLSGSYHILCREGKELRFHRIELHSDLEPAVLDFYEARKFIETHPLCANISQHDIRIMPISEVQDIFEGISPASRIRSLDLYEEEEVEERLH